MYRGQAIFNFTSNQQKYCQYRIEASGENVVRIESITFSVWNEMEFKSKKFNLSRRNLCTYTVGYNGRNGRKRILKK